jgi:hypothetical protein
LENHLPLAHHILLCLHSLLSGDSIAILGR